MILDSEQNGDLQAVVLDRVLGAGRPGAVLVSGAGIIDIFPALAAGDDGLVGIGDAHPFFLRHSLYLVYLVAFHPAVGRGAGYAVFVQIQGDGPFRRALQEHGIHALDDFSRIRIHNKLVLVLWVFDVAVGSERADILAVAPLVIKYLPVFL